jgi:pimeloyl-ACP methyl ester carboxylesterase
MVQSYLSSALLLLTATAAYGQSNETYIRPNSKSPTGVNMTEYGCGAECQEYIAKGTAGDRATFGDVPFDTDFYATAKNFSAQHSKPGDLLKMEPYINATSSWGLPPGATLYRMQYASVGENNTLVPATGSIILPFVHERHKKSLPVVAWAHGTIGTYYGCAPSSSYNIFDYTAWIPLYLAGYAVVAPDYAGLGNNYTAHHYLASTLQAKDMYYGMVASKTALGDLITNRWATAGHSQGGAAVWALTESEEVKLSSGSNCEEEAALEFIGGVAISPAPRIADHVATGLQENRTEPMCAHGPSVYQALEAAQPGSGADMIMPAMKKRMSLAEELGACFDVTAALGLELCENGGGAGELFNATAMQHYQPLYDFQAKYGAGLGKKTNAPMLVVQSQGDSTVPWTVTYEAWETSCKAGGAPVALSLYPALDHSATPGGSSFEWLGWLRERFEGKPVVDDCTKRDYTAVAKADAYLPLDEMH